MRSKNFAAQTNRNTARSSKVVLWLIAIIATSAFAVSAQQQTWYENSQDRSSIVTDKAVARQTFPKEFKLFNLNIEPLRQQLFAVAGDNARGQSTIISLPNAGGGIEYFEVSEASNFEPELQARFPEIRAYSGKGITDKYATLKLSISPQGIQTTVFRTETDNEFIEPYSQDHDVYVVYKTNREKGKLPWACSTEDKDLFSVWNSDLKLLPDAPSSSAGQIKTMRLAQSCNGEYANFFGATSASQVGLVLAAYNATLTRANGVYEKDLAVHLNLIPQTTAVIYYDPATDPYTTLSAWNGQLQATLTANIGEANYDIGHMFGASGGGGNAGCIGCVCVDGSKGSGITSPADSIPMGDNFDIDYVVHEMGHQMGANHSFSFQLEGTGQNKEIGSGITIMGYAGITPQDVAPHSIDTFHETNIQQIQTNLANKTCPVTTVMTANTPPVVAPVTNYTIPITTPFALTGSATDAQNDPLTYQWEQNDNSTVSGASSVASPTKVTGPNWLSFVPTTSPTRLFPRLSTILAGLAVTGPLPGGDAGTNIEALSSVSRTLNFRLTVRDNRPYVTGSTIGQTQFTDTTVTVTNTAGPFKVTTGNTATTITGGAARTITWDVANTDVAPISVANVKISLSTDGGQTFPTVLAASTPNDGSESVMIPNTPSTQARIKIEAIGNIFFDINDANLTIGVAGGPAEVTAGAVAIVSESCGIANGLPDPGETLTVSLPLSNTGGTATSNLTATLQASGGVTAAVSQSYGAIAAGGAAVSRNFTFTVSSALPCGNDVVLTFVVSDGATTFPNITKTYTTGVSSVSLSQNFDGVTAPALPTGWTSVQTSGTAISWTTTTTTPSSAPNAAFGNEAATVNAAALVSPAVAITSASAKISFKNQYNLESTYDGTVLEYTTNGGTTWTDVITGGGSFVSGGYTGPISSSFQSPIGGRMAWSGASTGYVDTVVNLPASLNGQSVQFRWLTASDSSVVATGAPGQWVDDVQVLGGRVCQICVLPSACAIQRKSDFTGDGITDYGIFRPSSGVWYVQPNGAGSAFGVAFGQAGDKLQPADYDGDGKADIGIYRSGAWYWIRSSDNTVRYAAWGAAGDIPVAGDYVGTAQAELAVYRPSSGVWYVLNLADNTMTAVQWGGAASDVPIPGDFDNDCKLDFAVRRTTNDPSAGATQFYIRLSAGGVASVRWGREDMALAIADYDGDGRSDVGVVDNNGGLLRWYVIKTNGAVLFSGTQFGQSGDIVTVGNYDADNKADLSIWRPSIGTFAYRSTVSGIEQQRVFGAASDIPTARASQYPLP